MDCEIFLPSLAGLLTTAQSYPSLSPSNNAIAGSGSTPAPSSGAQGLGQTLTMSLTSTSSDSEQVMLLTPIFKAHCYEEGTKKLN